MNHYNQPPYFFAPHMDTEDGPTLALTQDVKVNHQILSDELCLVAMQACYLYMTLQALVYYQASNKTNHRVCERRMVTKFHQDLTCLVYLHFFKFNQQKKLEEERAQRLSLKN